MKDDSELPTTRSLKRPPPNGLSAADYLPSEITYPRVVKAAAKCEGCELYLRATQTVFGEGAVPAAIMLIGEAPGESEDEAGKPFVGPAGRILDQALESAGLDRNQVYVTNAVKHFKWEVSGKRRLHARPSAREISACRPWLDVEIELVSPQVIVCLGATAAQALLGRDFRISQQRGQLQQLSDTCSVIASWHPSAILRNPREDARHEMRDELARDLKSAARHAR